MQVNQISSIQKLADFIFLQQKPMIVGVSGGVAVGKTTFATMLAEFITAKSVGAQVITTDNFLKSNNDLINANLLLYKGWPETYYLDKIISLLVDFKSSAKSRYTIPYYCHKKYDILSDNYLHFEQSSVLILEGVVALNPILLPYLDFKIYLDAKEEFAKNWFIDRCMVFIKDSVGDLTSFYHKWSAWDAEKIMPMLDDCWSHINLKNLQENIILTKKFADLVIEKDRGHNFIEFRNQSDA